MRERGPPSVGTLLLVLALLALGGPAVQGWLVAHGHCSPRFRGPFVPGGSRCFLFQDDRWDALLAGAVGVGALVVLGRIRSGAALVADEAHRARVTRFLRLVAAVALGMALWVGLGARPA